MNQHDGIIVCIGNPYRGDDNAGLLVCQRLKSLLKTPTQIVELTGDLFLLQDLLREKRWAIIVDSLHNKGQPMCGKIHRFEGTDSIKSQSEYWISTHEIDLATVINLVGHEGKMPTEIIIYGIEGCEFSIGKRMSKPVLDAVEKTVELIKNDISRILSSD